MTDMVRQPDRRLAEFVETFGVFTAPIATSHTLVNNMVTFNPFGVDLVIEGRPIATGTFFCVINDPPILEYQKNAGPIYTLRLRPGAMNRLFGIDPLTEREIKKADATRHQTLVSIERQLCGAADAVAKLDVMEQALCDLVDDADPAGLAEQFVALVEIHKGNINIASAAEQLGCTQRTLERACKRRFGRTPKRLSQGFRAVHTLMLEIDNGERPETDVTFPFADLPHYANELRRVSGMNRTQHRRMVEQGLEMQYLRVWSDGRVACNPEEMRQWQTEISLINTPSAGDN